MYLQIRKREKSQANACGRYWLSLEAVFLEIEHYGRHDAPVELRCAVDVFVEVEAKVGVETAIEVPVPEKVEYVSLYSDLVEQNLDEQNLDVGVPTEGFLEEDDLDLERVQQMEEVHLVAVFLLRGG